MATSVNGAVIPAVKVMTDATCMACGCLCDDLVLAVEQNRIVGAERACDLGRGWFLADHGQAGIQPATIQGCPTTPDEALDEAAAILRKTRAPVVLGLTQTSNEAVAAALAIADRLGAAVDIGNAAASIGTLRAIQRVGRVSATLGEVKTRADVVMFWGVDPLVTHPRHWERYSVEPRGRFIPEGRAGRTVIVADTRPTATAARADLYVPIAVETQGETLSALHAVVRGITLDPQRVQRATGMSLENLHSLAQRLTGARYGAFFFGEDLGRGRAGFACVEAALTLVRDLNAGTRRFVILPLGAAGNAPGAEAVLTGQGGSPQSVDFSDAVPRSLAEETSAAVRLERGEADAALIVADDVEGWLPDGARERLARLPRIVIAPRATVNHPTARVALAAATSGIDAPGTVTRVDGVVLPLRPPLSSPIPSDRRWLLALDDRLKTPESRS
jgi:formylmethanofuran dehydrogenase subunit B